MKNSHENGRELADWVAETGPLAVAYAQSLLKDRALAEDQVQECLYRLWRRREHYDLCRDGRKLLFRAVTRACCSELKRRGRWQGFHEDSAANPALAAESLVPPPEEFAMRGELLSWVQEGLARLPEIQRAALELRSMGFTNNEIADELACTTQYVAVLIHRARAELSRLLEPYFAERVS